MRGAALAFISLLASRASCRRWPECCTRRIRVVGTTVPQQLPCDKLPAGKARATSCPQANPVRQTAHRQFSLGQGSHSSLILNARCLGCFYLVASFTGELHDVRRMQRATPSRHDLSILNSKILKNHCSDTKANRSKTASKISVF